MISCTETAQIFFSQKREKKKINNLEHINKIDINTEWWHGEIEIRHEMQIKIVETRLQQQVAIR